MSYQRPKISALKAEIERLRAKLIDYDIDPDPEPSEQFGPATKYEMAMGEFVSATLRSRSTQLAENMLKNNALLRHLMK